MITTLYTPTTGFSDLEIKIAYGLARVGIEAGMKVNIFPQTGFYRIEFFSQNSDKESIDRTFHLILGRILSNQKFYDLGVKAKDRSKYPTIEEKKGFKSRLFNHKISDIYNEIKLSSFVFTKEKVCKHDKILKFGATKLSPKQLGGLIILTSPFAGKPQFRDKRSRDLNLGLCEVCGYLAVLGKESFTFNIQLGYGRDRKYIWVIPYFSKNLDQEQLIKLFSLQKTLDAFRLPEFIPLKVFTLGLLSKIPSLTEITNELGLSFYLCLVSKDNRGDTRVEQTLFVNAIPFANFLFYSPYNYATVDKLLSRSPKILPLLELTNLIENRRKENITKFARLYVQETSLKESKKVNFLYYQTTKYLLKEVAMIKNEIIENRAIQSLAKTLRYFVREKKYGYIDNLRNAKKESRDFEECLSKMLRETRLRFEQDKKIHPPREDEIREIFKLANENFEDVKISLVMLALSLPEKKEDFNEE